MASNMEGRPKPVFRRKILSRWMSRTLSVSVWTFGSLFLGSVPVLAATLDVSGVAPAGQIHDVSGNESYTQITAGNAANEIGTINVNAGNTLTTGSTGASGTLLGHGDATASGTINVSGAGASFTDLGSTYIGELGTGAINVSSGGTVTTGTSSIDTTYLGSQPTSSGTLTVDGAGSTWTDNGALTLGQPGAASGTVNVQNGGSLLVNGTLNINNGTVTATGTGSTFTANAGGNIGNGSQFVVSNGATVNLNNVGLYMNLGAGLDISGAGTTMRLQNPGNPTVGAWLTALGGSNISLTNGAYLYTDGGYIGGTDATQSQMTVNGPTTRWDATVRVYVGGSSGGTSSGNGKLTVSGGATVVSATGGVALDTNSTGTMILTGQGTTFAAAANSTLGTLGNFYVSYGGTGDVLVTDGALLQADHHISIASVGGSIGTLSIGAAQGSAAAAPGTITTPSIDFGDGTGKLVFNHTSTDYVFAPNITSTGVGTDVVGLYGGTTSFSGDLTAYTGDMTVDGGTLAIPSGQPLRLGGTYHQTAGSLHLGAASGQLVVTGAATFTAGSGMSVDAAGATTLANGGTISSVVSAGSLSASTFNVTDNSALFDFTATVNGSAVDLNVANSATVVASVNATGLTSGLGAAQVLDSWVAGGTTGTGIDNVVTALGRLSTQQQVSDAVSQTLPLLTGGSMIATRDALSGINHMVQTHLAGERGMSSGNSYLADRRFWIKPIGSWASQDARNGVAGFKANTVGLGLGVDALRSDKNRLGVAFAYSKSSVDSKSSVAPQSLDVGIYQLIGYGSYALDGDTALNFQLDYGRNTNDGSRSIVFMPAVAKSSYNSWTAHAGIGISRVMALTEKTRLIPSMRVDYTHVHDNAYTETGAGALDLSVASRSADAAIVSLDGELARKLSSRTTISAGLGVGYDALNDQASITAVYAGSPGASFATHGLKPSPWIGKAGMGMTYKVNDTADVTARYDADYRADYLNQTASLTLRWMF